MSNQKLMRWHDGRVTHECIGERAAPFDAGTFLVWTRCGRDVPAREAAYVADKITCGACRRIAELEHCNSQLKAECERKARDTESWRSECARLQRTDPPPTTALRLPRSLPANACFVPEQHYQVISVHNDDIPKGAKLVECYETEKEIIVVGSPQSDDPEHNCDALGCSTLSHVLHRFDKARQVALRAPAEQAQTDSKTNPYAHLNTGHGHVRPRPDGFKARCGGPSICRECALEKAGLTKQGAP